MDDMIISGGPASAGVGAVEAGLSGGRGPPLRGRRPLRGQSDERWRRGGTVAPERYGGRKCSALAAHAGRVQDLLRASLTSHRRAAHRLQPKRST